MILQDDENAQAIMAQFQAAYSTLMGQIERLSEQNQNLAIEKETEKNLISHELNQKTIYYETLLNDKNKRINQLEIHIKKLEADDSEKNRKEIRRYIESNNEKEAQNNALKKQINSYKTKINSLETEITNITNIKDDLELFIVKGMEQLKIMNKQINNNIEETDTEKMVMESKYKQTNEKMVMLTEKINELEIKLRSAEESYDKLKNLFKQSKDECLNQKFEIQGLKEQIRSMKLGGSLVRASFDDNNLLNQEVSSIIELGNILKERQHFIKQVSQYHEMNVSLIQENSSLKDKIVANERAIDDLKTLYVAGYQDQVLKKSNLSLFEFFQEKKSQFLHFEQIIQKIETYIEEKDELINKLIGNFTEKNQKCACGKEAEFTNLQSEFDMNAKKIEQLQETIQKLRKDAASYERLIDVYKAQVREILTVEGGRAKGKKKIQKRRCLNCYISMQKNDATETCMDCKRIFHPECILEHKCDTYKMEDLSWISGME